MNIVLVGMPGSGKSTVGRRLAHLLGRPFVETDALVESREGRSIPDIFASCGEGGFRTIEAAAVRAAAEGDGAVISTGGGTVLRDENMAALAQNGVILFLDRPPEEIAGLDHGGRPLMAGGRERVFELYTSRISLYQKYARYTIQSGKTVEDTAQAALSLLRKEGHL